MSTHLPIAPAPVPIVIDAQGVARVGGTRVTLDSIVGSYQQGNPPERIAEQFDTVPLADIYAVISFYLHNRTSVDVYLAEADQLAERLREQNNQNPRVASLRARLSERQQGK